ncbi:MAG: hypothetical protein J6T22_09345 [Bacteroidales bacterium]|nr:hypothetical protein [Bacteroidales bacterium]MBO7617398.1 hypothetical protein [Bacteroidales bacterium]
MEARELMVGDWVFEKSSGNPVEVTLEIMGYCTIYSNEHYEPIPLTAEILQKNGFNKIDENTYSFRRCCGDGEIKIRVIDLTCGEWELYAMDYDKYSDTRISFSNEQSFLKVHELQHALKLCGIDKEIKL